uniref:MFS domain-containing protein n=1 Tax=Strongyloides papillosus TaxID=174720 RepID=A0A0N5B3B2_STREA
MVNVSKEINNIFYLGSKNYYIIILYLLSSATWALTAIVIFLPTFIMKKISCREDNKDWCNSRLNDSISIEETFNLSDYECELFNQSFFIGNIIGSTFQSYLADVYGRKLIVLPSFFLTSLLGFLMTCFSKYVYIVIIRFCQGLLLSAADGIIFVLATENSPLKSHAIISLASNLSFAFGLILLVPISYYFPNWKTAILIAHTPAFILPIILWFILPESLHFLFEKKEKVKIKIWIDNVNKYSRQSLKVDIDSCIKKFHSSDGEFMKGGYINKGLVKVIQYYYLNRKYILYLLMVIFIWFNEFLSYYVFTENATALSGNPYLNFIFIALVEFPTSVIGPITIDKYVYKLTNPLYFVIF